MKIKQIVVRGKEVKSYLKEMASLRIDIFREWPYLYDGDLEWEIKYLMMFEKAPDAFWVISIAGDQVIGGVTGIPLIEAIEEVRKPFEEKKLMINNLYYLGEILLRPPYRGQKIGLKMYEIFENEVRKLEQYDSVCHCEIVRDKDDSRRPVDYKPLDIFWDKQGYQTLDDITITSAYQEIGKKKKSPHLMIFRDKKL